jgi:Holliday junction resolvasome RuvABC endonuclease subunit
MQTILGIDCSSSTIGWAYMGVDGSTIKLLDHGHIKPPAKDDNHLIQRLDSIAKTMEELCSRFNPDFTIVEEISQFMKGRTSANTIITLAVFNRACALQLYRSTKKVPLFLLPISIRTRIKRFLGRQEVIEKEQIPGILQDYFGKSFFKVVGYKQRGKNKGQPVVETYDEADAVAAAWAGLIELGLIKGANE